MLMPKFYLCSRTRATFIQSMCLRMGPLNDLLPRVPRKSIRETRTSNQQIHFQPPKKTLPPSALKLPHVTHHHTLLKPLLHGNLLQNDPKNNQRRRSDGKEAISTRNSTIRTPNTFRGSKNQELDYEIWFHDFNESG